MLRLTTDFNVFLFVAFFKVLSNYFELKEQKQQQRNKRKCEIKIQIWAITTVVHFPSQSTTVCVFSIIHLNSAQPVLTQTYLLADTLLLLPITTPLHTTHYKLNIKYTVHITLHTKCTVHSTLNTLQILNLTLNPETLQKLNYTLKTKYTDTAQ